MALGAIFAVGAGAGIAFAGYKYKQRRDAREMNSNLHDAAELQKLNRTEERENMATAE